MFKEKFQNDIDNCNQSCSEDICDVTAFQEIDVRVPITIEPYVNLSEAIVECVEDPYLMPVSCCACNKNGTCKFAIAQKLCIIVPVEFKAIASSGPISVICGDTSDGDCISNVFDENAGYEPEPELEPEPEYDPQPQNKYYIKGKLVK